MLKKLRLKILNHLLKSLFNTVSEEDVFRVVNGKMYVGRNIMSAADQQQILIDVRLIKESTFWRLLIDDMKYSANENIYKKSVSMDDIVFGKAVLWCIDVMEKKLSNLSQMK